MGIQKRILECVAISFSRGFSDPGIRFTSPVSPALQMDSLPAGPSGKPHQILKHTIRPLSHGLGRCPEGEHGNLLQHSCLENPLEQKSLVDYSPWYCKELDMTERLSTLKGSIIKTYGVADGR